MTPPGRKIVAAHLADHEFDENQGLKGYVKATDYTLPYMSQWSRANDDDVQSELLRHMNCNYLSTHGVPPTLLALKQHAQSLCALIQMLQPDIKVAEVDADGAASTSKANASSADDALGLKFELNSAFDFLNDLRTPYHNDDVYHHKPLVSLINEVRGRNEVYGTDYHCPLTEIQHHSPPAPGEVTTTPVPGQSAADQPRELRPYANLQNLLVHTNSCLERLDHEYTATGGLLSVLPTDAEHDTEELKHARTTLLGQWLLFTQHLVARMHELERSYGNALDALAGEAAIPHQVLGKLGPDGRSGRVVAYPQDQYILVNSGDDVYEYIHSLLDKREAVLQAKERVYRRNGAVGEELWHKNPQISGEGADDGTGAGIGIGGGNSLFEQMEKVDADLIGGYFSRGIVQVDVTTRYYRLANSGKSVLFVVPAHAVHPGVEHTRLLETQPTIMATVQPRYPPRASELESKYNRKLREASKIQQENLDLQSEVGSAKDQIRTLKAEVERLSLARDALLNGVGKSEVEAKREAEVLRRRAERAERVVRELQKGSSGSGGKVSSSSMGRTLADYDDDVSDEYGEGMDYDWDP
ncbi:hypothetical protein B0T20DRAFT_203948 [Sordaria brevicollis]|uniref:Uncharacterized protein n=1 Tax=Sordaria brevicollis TaxID=83679 RepID=A0AAE0PE24_SORBR|nr:hypothetical protein B0T20DRAFT_203948 [Sordaria brevicollis]